MSDEIREKFLPGDYFIHAGTGKRFICRAVIRHDYDGMDSPLRIELESERKSDGVLSIFNAEKAVESYMEALGVPGRIIR